jgi:hypothetical protein
MAGQGVRWAGQGVRWAGQGVRWAGQVSGGPDTRIASDAPRGVLRQVPPVGSLRTEVCL